MHPTCRARESSNCYRGRSRSPERPSRKGQKRRRSQTTTTERKVRSSPASTTPPTNTRPSACQKVTSNKSARDCDLKRPPPRAESTTDDRRGRKTPTGAATVSDAANDTRPVTMKEVFKALETQRDEVLAAVDAKKQEELQEQLDRCQAAAEDKRMQEISLSLIHISEPTRP